jgi:hypothetical protein
MDYGTGFVQNSILENSEVRSQRIEERYHSLRKSFTITIDGQNEPMRFLPDKITDHPQSGWFDEAPSKGSKSLTNKR